MSKGTVIAKTGIKRKKNYLYYVNKDGNVVETAMNRCGRGGKKSCKPNKNISDTMDGSKPRKYKRLKSKFKTQAEAWKDIESRTGLKRTDVVAKHLKTAWVFEKK